MKILLFIVFLITMISYFGFKGIIIRNSLKARIPLFVLTLIFGILSFFLVFELFSLTFQIIIGGYLVWSYISYLILNFYGRRNNTINYIKKLIFIVIYVENEESIIKYQIIKLPFAFLVNLIVLFASRKWLNFYGGIYVSVKSKNNKVEICF